MSSWIAGSSIDLPKILFVWPQPKPLALPLHLPDNVSRYFLQAQDNLARQAWDAAGGMFRKSLDTGLIKLNLGPARGNLKSRIDQMPESSGVTPAMKEWAHEVRLLGNDAMHDDEPFSEPDAKALASFTEMFLTYAFSLPGMLAERRLQTQPGGRSESRSKIMLSFDRGVAA